jgi:hypothetical protein
MNNNLVEQYVNCFLDASKIDDPMEARLPLYKAQETQKQMIPEELFLARKRIILALLANQNYSAALGYLEDEFKDSPELRADAEIKTAAAKAYSSAMTNQLEIAEDIKAIFKLKP